MPAAPARRCSVPRTGGYGCCKPGSKHRARPGRQGPGTGAHAIPQLRGSQQPLLRITNYAIIAHFLNDFCLSKSFATAHWYFQPTATCSHRPAGASRPGPFPKSGTDGVVEHGSRDPRSGTLPRQLPPVLAPGCVPKGTVPLPRARGAPGGLSQPLHAWAAGCPAQPLPLEQPHFTPLRTWPRQECVSAHPWFPQPLGCPEAFLALLRHAPGLSARWHFPEHSPEPHTAPRRGHPSHGDAFEEPRRVLDAGRGLLPALVADEEPLTQQLFGSRRSNKACGGLPGWGRGRERPREWAPRRPKANPRGSPGVRRGVSPEEGADTGTLSPEESQGRSPEPPGASPRPGAACAPSCRQDQEFELCRCRAMAWQELRQESGGCGLRGEKPRREDGENHQQG